MTTTTEHPRVTALRALLSVRHVACPAAAVLSESRDLRSRFCSEFAEMEKHPLNAHYQRDFRPAEVRRAEYIARRFTELRRWNPGCVFAG